MVQMFFVLHVLYEDSAWNPTLENRDTKIIKKNCQSYFSDSSDSQWIGTFQEIAVDKYGLSIGFVPQTYIVTTQI